MWQTEMADFAKYGPKLYNRNSQILLWSKALGAASDVDSNEASGVTYRLCVSWSHEVSAQGYVNCGLYLS